VDSVGHLLFFGQGGHISHADTRDNIKLFAKEVFPLLAERNKGAPKSNRPPARAAAG
jgi:hypothetical protein